MGHKAGTLTFRQKKMVDEYLICGNKCEAAERAGYKRNYAQGAFLQSAVKEYLQKRLEEIGNVDIVKIMNDLRKENKNLKKENEKLKKELKKYGKNECKTA